MPRDLSGRVSQLGAPVSASEFADLLLAWLRERCDTPPAVLTQLRRGADEAHSDFARLLTRSGAVADQLIAQGIAELTGVQLVERLEDLPVLCELPEVSRKFLRDQLAVIVQGDGDPLHVIAAYPHEPYVEQAIAAATGRAVALSCGVASQLVRSFETADRSAAAASSLVDVVSLDSAALRDLISDAPVVRYVDRLLSLAVERGASDIHVEPFPHEVRVRLRIDGLLQSCDPPAGTQADAVISRIKLLGGIDIAERRLPQDGRTMVRVQGRSVDLRLSTIPTLHGESLVVRLLDKSTIARSFELLGFAPDTERELRDCLQVRDGILLVTGPTGSGKTTTLYTALGEMAGDDTKVLTVEDPVEYQLEGVNQIQVKPTIGLDFPAALRAILRHDPDIIMIGEMRDSETARIAVQSSLTGHRVLSTLHTNDAGSTLVRLFDMGIEPYLVASTLRGVLAQRLARRLCTSCRSFEPVPARVATDFGIGPDELPDRAGRHVGCVSCRMSGHRGRVAVAEFLRVSDSIRQLINERADGVALQSAARRSGMRDMLRDALRHVAAGNISLQEALRVARG